MVPPLPTSVVCLTEVTNEAIDLNLNNTSDNWKNSNADVCSYSS